MNEKPAEPPPPVFVQRGRDPCIVLDLPGHRIDQLGFYSVSTDCSCLGWHEALIWCVHHFILLLRFGIVHPMFPVFIEYMYFHLPIMFSFI